MKSKKPTTKRVVKVAKGKCDTCGRSKLQTGTK